jgi:hypothetical protein
MLAELYWQGKTAEPGEKLALVPLSQPQISHEPTRDRTPVLAVTAQYSVQGYCFRLLVVFRQRATDMLKST